MNPRIVFLVMSAVSKPGTIDQLARALAPHLVLVHHDFSQTPDFPLTAPNVHFVPDPKRTGWAAFGFSEGIFHSMQYALAHFDFDYLQAAKSDLPAHQAPSPVRGARLRACGGALRLYRSAERSRCLDVGRVPGLHAGEVASASSGQAVVECLFRHRIRQARRGRHLAENRRWQRPGLLDRGLHHQCLGPAFDRAPHFRRNIPSVLRLDVVRRTPACHRRNGGSFSRPGLRDYFSRLRIADECLIPTLLKHLGPVQGPMNHYVHTFVEAHPGQIGEENFEPLRTSPAYFARKFADDPEAPLRARVLRELVGIPPPRRTV